MIVITTDKLLSIFIALFVVGLSAYGLTVLLRYTDGPFDIFLRLRKLVGIKLEPVYDNEDNVVDIIEEVQPDKPLAALMYCYWCLTTWISLFISIAICLLLGILIFTPFVWFAAVGISGYMYGKLELDHG